MKHNPIGPHGWTITTDAFPGKYTLCTPDGRPHSSENNTDAGRRAINEGWGIAYWSKPVNQTTGCDDV